MRAEILARFESKLRPHIVSELPPKRAIELYSRGRADFIRRLDRDIPQETYHPPEHCERTIWELTFRSPIMNAAGMFKNCEAYETMYRQGSGGYMGGTGTYNSREGNSRDGIRHPFVPYPRSHAASNWLGLPNDGDEVNAMRVAALPRYPHFPIGWSVMGSPDFEGQEKLSKLVTSMYLYEGAGIDFLELNESCPNTTHGRPQDDALAERLTFIKKNFLDHRKRNLPVVVKFSNDTQEEQVPDLLQLLLDLGFDGINFGNTSTAYTSHIGSIDPHERPLYDHFTTSSAFGVGGGVSGAPLRNSSLKLTTIAADYLKHVRSDREFAVIRTGGVETVHDILDSTFNGVNMNQWYTGYFENFATSGHYLYRHLLEGK